MRRGSREINAEVILVPGTPNGGFRTDQPGGLYCPTNQAVDAIRDVYSGRIQTHYLNWADHPNLPRKGFLGRHARHVPIYALPAMFKSYQNDPRMRHFILDLLKAEILKSRNNTNDLYLIGHSLGAAIICEAVKELLEENKIQRDEEKRLYLLLLSPAIGSLMGGIIRPTLTLEDLQGVAVFADGIGEMRVLKDELSAHTGWNYLEGVDPKQIWSVSLVPPFGRRGIQMGLGILGHNLVGRWCAHIFRPQIQQWAELPPRVPQTAHAA